MSGASEAFSLAMKTNNCLRICVLPGMRVFTWHMRPQLVYVSAPSEYVFTSNKSASLSASPPPLEYAHKISCTYHPVLKSTKSLDGDRGMWYGQMPLCRDFQRHFNKVHTRTILYLNETNNYKKAKMKGGLCWMTNDYRE